MSSALNIRRWRHRPNEAANWECTVTQSWTFGGQDKERCCTGIMMWLRSSTLVVQHECSQRDTTVRCYWASTSGYADRTWPALGPQTMEITVGQISKSTSWKQRIAAQVPRSQDGLLWKNLHCDDFPSSTAFFVATGCDFYKSRSSNAMLITKVV